MRRTLRMVTVVAVSVATMTPTLSYLPAGLGVAVAVADKAPTTDGLISLDRSDGVYIVNPDGSGERLIVPNSCCAGWSPDGSKLAMGYGTDDGRIGTAVINWDGTGLMTFSIPDPSLNVACGTWSLDGMRLACESWDDSDPARDGIYTVSAEDGSSLTRLTRNPLGGHDIPNSFSPDGQRLVFTRTDADGNNVGLFVVKTNDGQLRQIVPATALVNIGASWSPQGNEIIFSRHVTPQRRGSIWVVHSDGTGLRELNIDGVACGGSVFDPNGYGCHGVGWSPDGKKIIFVAKSPATGGNIYIANADGTSPIAVATDGDDDDPAWGTHPTTS